MTTQACMAYATPSAVHTRSDVLSNQSNQRVMKSFELALRPAAGQTVRNP